MARKVCQFAKMTTIILLGKASDKHVVCFESPAWKLCRLLIFFILRIGSLQKKWNNG